MPPSVPPVSRAARWQKLQLLGVGSVFALLGSFLRPPLEATAIDDFARQLGGSVGGLAGLAHGKVLPADIRWESSQGPLLDYVVGRRVLFLASETAEGSRDLYRARVRVAPEGRVLQIFEPKNLTGTPLGDDHALVLAHDRAAFATFVYGQEQTVTYLDLTGERPESPGPDRTLADRVTEYLSRWQDTGSGAGIRRVEVSLVPPARAVGLAMDPIKNELSIDLVDDAGKRSTAVLDGEKDELSGSASGLHAEVVRRLPKRFILWAVDTVRASVGPAPIAWLEEHVFAARDSLRRATFEARGGSDQVLAEANAPSSPPAPLPAALDASSAASDGTTWPPAPIASIWKTREPGEGEWQEPHTAWSTKHEGPPAHDGPPPPFYRTFVRPDPERPYSRVILVAMDMRQLDLAMEAGTEDPKPLTGGHGPGRIPRDPAVASRVVAAFNGGFKTEHGNYGMMVNHRILLPPQPSAATVVLFKDQRVGFGTWADTHDVTGIRGVRDEDILSFRQNLDPLVDNGEVNPMGRALWGYTLPGSGMQTERSGLCVTDDGRVLYAWGDDVSGTALGKALKLAGCTYAVHLDMNPHHTGFIFSKINDLRGHNYRSELLTPLMTVSPDRYIEYAPKDFFYVLMHDGTPDPLDGAAFHPDPGAQPSPAWAPAIWSTTAAAADTNESKQPSIEVLMVEAGRARFRIRGGMKEPDAKTGASPVHELLGEDAHKVVMALGLGHALEKKPRGLATDGRLSYPMHALEVGGEAESRYAGLVVDADGGLSIVHARDITSIGSHVDLAELPLLLDEGELVPESSAKNPSLSPRGALCLAPDGRLLVARATLSSDAPLAVVLSHAGCRRVVGLDRGAHAPPFLQRVGTSTPPRGRSDETALYVLSAPMKPRAFRFESATVVAQATHTK